MGCKPSKGQKCAFDPKCRRRKPSQGIPAWVNLATYPDVELEHGLGAGSLLAAPAPAVLAPAHRAFARHAIPHAVDIGRRLAGWPVATEVVEEPIPVAEGDASESAAYSAASLALPMRPREPAATSASSRWPRRRSGS